MIKRCIGFATSVTILLAMAACTGPLGGDDDEAKPWDREIPATDYRLSDVRCESKPGRTNVDGEIVDDTHWVVVGTLHNELAVGSPTYDLRATTTRSNGDINEIGSTLFRPIFAGGSAEFRILVGGEARGEGGAVTECEVAVFDSVLNYAR